jgi:predicted metal-dependent phosphoesterase TrpH
MQWYRMDLHVHTPCSADFQEPGVSYIDLLRQAELRGLDIVSFTDHNTVAGYRTMMDDITRLQYLEKLGRIQPE